MSEVNEVKPSKTELNNIYRGKYKEGPVLKEFFFTATNQEHALKQYTKYVKYLESIAEHNRSLIPVGKVEPFAIDVDKFIALDREKREKLNVT